VYAGRGILVIDSTSGEVVQRIGWKEDDGNDALFTNPVFVNGKLVALATHGNLLEMYGDDIVQGSEVDRLLSIGFVKRRYEWDLKVHDVYCRFDGKPAPPLPNPRDHTGFSCSGDSIYIFE
jgi:hypothetical protein